MFVKLFIAFPHKTVNINYIGPKALANALKDDAELFGGKATITVVPQFTQHENGDRTCNLHECDVYECSCAWQRKPFSLEEEAQAEAMAGCHH